VTIKSAKNMRQPPSYYCNLLFLLCFL